MTVTTAGVRDLPLPDDTDVWITSGDQPTPGRVVSAAGTPRSYVVDTPNGQVRRNRFHLNERPAEPEAAETVPEQIMTRSRTGTIER